MILITWWGLPQYAARAIGAFVRQTKESVRIISTRPAVPIKGMEELVECPVEWVSDEQSMIAAEGERLFAGLGEVPRMMIVSNWNLPMYKVMEDKVRAAGGKVIAVSDANYQVDFKQLLRALRFRFSLAKRFDYFFVPGKSGRKLMRFYGVPDSKIFEGLYAADQSLFHDTKSMLEREKKIIYVGQFIDRKNVLRVAQAFLKSGIAALGWRLEMCGSGPLKEALLKNTNYQLSTTNSSILIRDFVQPEQLAAKYQEARCFILASLEEHWGVVVHEAALSGCYLLLSKGIGAADDFASSENAGVFDPFSIDSIAESMKRMAGLDDAAMLKAEKVSSKLGLDAGTQKFVSSMEKMCGAV